MDDIFDYDYRKNFIIAQHPPNRGLLPSSMFIYGDFMDGPAPGMLACRFTISADDVMNCGNQVILVIRATIPARHPSRLGSSAGNGADWRRSPYA